MELLEDEKMMMVEEPIPEMEEGIVNSRTMGEESMAMVYMPEDDRDELEKELDELREEELMEELMSDSNVIVDTRVHEVRMPRPVSMTRTKSEEKELMDMMMT